MKVISVIVDEVPESCNECMYQYYGAYGGDMYCCVAGKGLNAGTSCPDWCPLVTESDYKALPQVNKSNDLQK